jgi:Domain of unknown function (DUF4372)
MLQVCSVYSQLLQLFSREQFARAVKHHQAERNAKGFSSWEQFVAMLFCQLAHLNSLRWGSTDRDEHPGKGAQSCGDCNCLFPATSALPYQRRFQS